MSVASDIAALFARRGAGAYFGEPVSMLEHGLQAAHFAELAHATPVLVVAALLHDIGHLVEEVPADIADWTSDAHHEDVGAQWLGRYFGPAVCDPVRLHVPAKRYLCATNPVYRQRLSPASVHTLALQGGPMTAAEARAFESEPYYRDAVQVRYWDEAGKVHGLVTRPFEAYLELIDELATRRT